MKTVDELKKKLGKPGRLAGLLLPDDFAGEDQVAATIARNFKDLKPTQVRRIFQTIKQVEHRSRKARDEDRLDDNDRTRLTLLSPELAYAYGRQLIPRDFYEILKLSLSKEKMHTVGDLRRLSQFISAVIAYQKFYSK